MPQSIVAWKTKSNNQSFLLGIVCGNWVRISINLTWQNIRNGFEREREKKRNEKKKTIRNENNNGKLKFVYFTFWLNGLIKLYSEEKFVMLCATVLRA